MWFSLAMVTPVCNASVFKAHISELEVC